MSSSTRGLSSSNWRTKEEGHDTLSSKPRQWEQASGSHSSHSSHSPHNQHKKEKWAEKRLRPGRNDGMSLKLEEPRIYVGNMPYMARKEDVEALFNEAGFSIRNIDISIDRFTGCNPSYCFLDLHSVEAAESAMHTLNGKMFLGRPLKIKPSTKKKAPAPKTSTENVNFNRWQGGQNQGGLSFPHGTAGADPRVSPTEFLEPIVQNRRLYVGGLPKPQDQHTSSIEIASLFKNFNVEAVSKVKSPHESVKDKPGNHFYAFVDFSCREEAAAAAKEMNGKFAFGERLRVSLADSVPGKVFERAEYERTVNMGEMADDNYR